MADHSAPSSSSAPEAAYLKQPTPVPNSKWVGTVKTFTDALGAPRLLKSGVPVQTVEEADEAKWGNDESGVDLVRVDGASAVAPKASSIFLQANSMKEFNALIGDFASLGLKVKDPVTRLVVYRDARIGPAIKTEVITFGSFYLNEDKRNLDNSDVVGVVDVGHNPPPHKHRNEV